MVDQVQRAFSEVAVDWQETMVLRRYAAYPLPALTDIGPAAAANKHTTPLPQSTTPGLHPVSIHQMSQLQERWQNPITAYYSFISTSKG